VVAAAAAEDMAVEVDTVAVAVVVAASLLPTLPLLAGPDGSTIDSMPSKRIVLCGVVESCLDLASLVTFILLRSQ